MIDHVTIGVTDLDQQRAVGFQRQVFVTNVAILLQVAHGGFIGRLVAE